CEQQPKHRTDFSPESRFNNREACHEKPKHHGPEKEYQQGKDQPLPRITNMFQHDLLLFVWLVSSPDTGTGTKLNFFCQRFDSLFLPKSVFTILVRICIC